MDTDENFTDFILTRFPEWLETLNGHLTKKYIVSDKMTMADIYIASIFLAHCFNERYENCHIL
jgi:glutathione S-transferase